MAHSGLAFTNCGCVKAGGHRPATTPHHQPTEYPKSLGWKSAPVMITGNRFRPVCLTFRTAMAHPVKRGRFGVLTGGTDGRTNGGANRVGGASPVGCVQLRLAH